MSVIWGQETFPIGIHCRKAYFFGPRNSSWGSQSRGGVATIVQRGLAAPKRALGADGVGEGAGGVAVRAGPAAVAGPPFALRPVVRAEDNVGVVARAERVHRLDHRFEAIHVRVRLHPPEDLRSLRGPRRKTGTSVCQSHTKFHSSNAGVPGRWSFSRRTCQLHGSQSAPPLAAWQDAVAGNRQVV
jgi:hypothetical protein